MAMETGSIPVGGEAMSGSLVNKKKTMLNLKIDCLQVKLLQRNLAENSGNNSISHRVGAEAVQKLTTIMTSDSDDNVNCQDH